MHTVPVAPPVEGFGHAACEAEAEEAATLLPAHMHPTGTGLLPTAQPLPPPPQPPSPPLPAPPELRDIAVRSLGSADRERQRSLGSLSTDTVCSLSFLVREGGRTSGDLG